LINFGSADVKIKPELLIYTYVDICRLVLFVTTPAPRKKAGNAILPLGLFLTCRRKNKTRGTRNMRA
jgi:hypothetical protein